MHLLLDLFLNSFSPSDVKLLHLLVLQGLRHKLYGKSFVLAHRKICIYFPTDQQKFRHQTEKHNVGLGLGLGLGGGGSHFSLTDVQIGFLLLKVLNYIYSVHKYIHTVGANVQVNTKI